MRKRAKREAKSVAPKRVAREAERVASMRPVRAAVESEPPAVAAVAAPVEPMHPEVAAGEPVRVAAGAAAQAKTFRRAEAGVAAVA